MVDKGERRSPRSAGRASVRGQPFSAFLFDLPFYCEVQFVQLNRVELPVTKENRVKYEQNI